MQDNMEYIELFDGEKNIELKLLDTFGVEDKDYAALLDEEKDELYILEVEFDEDDAVFKTIDDEKEFNDILAIYNDLLEEEDDEDK